MKNSASVENRKKTTCFNVYDYAAQKICDRNRRVKSMLFCCVLEVVFNALHLTVFNDENKPFMLSMVHY